MTILRGKLLLISATVVVIVAVLLGIAWLVQHNFEAVRDCYLQEQVAEMIIEYMERNKGAWPQDWEELSEAYEICQAGPRRSWSTFEEIQYQRFKCDRCY